MKAVVLEKENGLCAVLKEDGTFAKVRMAASVGEEVDIPMIASISYMPLRRVVAAACIVLLTVFSALTALVQEYTYVSMDVGPSIEYALNRIDRVINVEALNPDGEDLLEDMKDEHLNGSPIDDAVSTTTGALHRNGYLEGNTAEETVLLAVTSKSKAKSEAISKVMEKNFVDEEVTVDMEKVSLKDRKEAKNYGLSTGRYVKAKEIAGSEKLDKATIDMARTTSVEALVKTASTAMKKKHSASQKNSVSAPKESKPAQADGSKSGSKAGTQKTEDNSSAVSNSSSTTPAETPVTTKPATTTDVAAGISTETAAPSESGSSGGSDSSGTSGGSSSGGSSSGSSGSSSQGSDATSGSSESGSSSGSEEVVVDPIKDPDENEVDRDESEPKKFQDDGSGTSSDSTGSGSDSESGSGN